MNDHGHDPVCLGGGTDQPCLGSDRCCSPGPDAREDSPSPDPPHEQTSTRVEPHDNGHGDGDGGEETTESPTTKTKTTTTTAKDDGDEITTTKDVASTTKHETTEKPTTTKKPSSTAPRPTSEAEETTTETKTTTRPNTGPTEIMTVAPPVSQATDSPTSVMPTSSIGTLMPTAGNTTSSAAPAPAPGQEDKGVDVTAVAAGVGGAIALMLVLVILGYLIRKRRHSKRMSSTRAESPLPFDDKTGTAEGGALTAPSSLGGKYTIILRKTFYQNHVLTLAMKKQLSQALLSSSHRPIHLLTRHQPITVPTEQCLLMRRSHRLLPPSGLVLYLAGAIPTRRLATILVVTRLRNHSCRQ